LHDAKIEVFLLSKGKNKIVMIVREITNLDSVSMKLALLKN
jgi:hypothetical protein